MVLSDYHVLVVEDDLDAIRSLKTACPKEGVTFSVVDPAHSLDPSYVQQKVHEGVGRRVIGFVDLNYKLRKDQGESLDLDGGDVVKKWASWRADGTLPEGLEAVCVRTSHSNLIDPRNPYMKLRRANPVLKVFGLEKKGVYGDQGMDWLLLYDAGDVRDQLNVVRNPV
ncbi:MAG: hypothetical protein AABX37_00640 [Nanoarchaeota archaeon]